MVSSTDAVAMFENVLITFRNNYRQLASSLFISTHNITFLEAQKWGSLNGVMPVSSFTQIRRQPNQKLLQDTH
jgi:hypothetical protein